MAERFLKKEPLAELTSVCTKETLAELQKQCREVYIHPELLKYMVELIQATRKHGKVAHGVSPRGTLAFVHAAQGHAMVSGREYVVPEDIKAVAVPVLAHRLSLSVDADGSRAAKKIIEDLLGSVSLPTEDWTKR